MFCGILGQNERNTFWKGNSGGGVLKWPELKKNSFPTL